jgi:iron complex transport system permease protein
MRRPPIWLLLAGLVLVIMLLSIASMSAGRVMVPWSAWTSWGEDPRWAIVFELRLPRTLLAILVGAALGAAGAALQGYVRNPLADPGTLGVSQIAAFAAVMTIYLGTASAVPWLLSVCAIAGAIVGVIALLLLAGASSSVTTFVLAGAILTTIGSAGVALALTLAPSPWAVNEIINWLMGSLADRSFDDVKLAAPFIGAGLVLLMLTGPALDALTLGDTGAKALGVDMTRTRILIAAGVGLTVGASVASTGIISFVGLVTPHLIRPLVGGRPRALLLPSALAGAALVLAADMIVRLTPSQTEVRLGVAMAALGGPFFLWLLLAMRRRMA